MKQSVEQMYATMQRGMEAREDLGRVNPKLMERRETLIHQAIMAYRSKATPYTGQDALLFVAALSENLQLRDDLNAEVSDGQRAQRRLEREA